MMPLKLREWRALANITQRGLAARSGVALATIKRLEADRGYTARPGTRQRLADALGITAQELLFLPPGFAAMHGPARVEPAYARSEFAGAKSEPAFAKSEFAGARATPIGGVEGEES